MRSIKYELRPTTGQKSKLDKIFGCCRFVYNYSLDKKSTAFSERGEKISCYDLIREITALKKNPDYAWLKEPFLAALQQSVLRLEKAYSNFYSKKGNFPRFKRKNDKQSFRIPNKIRVDYVSYKFYVPKIGWIRFYRDKSINDNIKFATITKSATNRYFVGITYETNMEQIYGKGSVGIDLGIKNFLTTSDGEVFENQKYLLRNERALRINKRKLDRKRVASLGMGKNYEKQRVIVARIYEKGVNKKRDYLHKLSTYLTRTYETICMEDLGVIDMIKDKRFSKELHNIGWALFKNMMVYKAKDLRIIDRYAPSTMTCSQCGYKHTKFSPDIREWQCPVCGENHDRDINAAVNIKNIGLRISTLGGNVNDCVEHCQRVAS